MEGEWTHTSRRYSTPSGVSRSIFTTLRVSMVSDLSNRRFEVGSNSPSSSSSSNILGVGDERPRSASALARCCLLSLILERLVAFFGSLMLTVPECPAGSSVIYRAVRYLANLMLGGGIIAFESPCCTNIIRSPPSFKFAPYHTKYASSLRL